MGSDSEQKKQSEPPPTGLASEDRIEAKIDRDLQDSFPASDPPGWVLGVKRPSAKNAEQDEGSSPAATDDAQEG